MATKVTVETTNNFSAWIHAQTNDLISAGRAMGNAIVSGAQMVVPRDTSALANSAKVTNESTLIKVTFGDASVRYAAVQELGSRKGIPFKHYTTPGTGPHYLEKTGDAVAKKGLKPYL